MPTATEYHAPPAGYTPPTTCETCGTEVILSTGIIGTHRAWVHLTRHTGIEEHPVAVPRWWDVNTGEWVDGPAIPYPDDPRDAANQDAPASTPA